MSLIDRKPKWIAPMIQITSYYEADEILKSAAFVSSMEAESAPFRGGALLDLDGEPQQTRRRLQASLFNRSALRFYERDVLDPAIGRGLVEVANRRDSDGIVRTDLVSLVRRILAQLAATLVGIDLGTDGQRTSVLLDYLVPLFDGLAVKWANDNHDALIRRALGPKGRFVGQFFRDSCARREELIKLHREGRLQATELPNDLLTVMLLNKAAEWTEDLLVREALIHLVSVVYTTGGAIVQAVEELDGWLGGHHTDVARVTDSEFLRRVSNEILRLRFGIPGLTRRAVYDTFLKSGRQVRAGDSFSLRHDAMNRDIAVCGLDAKQFNPYRTVPDGVRPYALAFGSGPKACIAKPLVTAVSGPGEAHKDLDRVMVRVLKALYAHGVKVDHSKTVVRSETTTEDRYEYFAVYFDAL
jgi:cytochrome P450